MMVAVHRDPARAVGAVVLPMHLVPANVAAVTGQTQLQRSAAADAGALLRAGCWASGDGADCGLHVGDGGQRERVRHSVDVRHLRAFLNKKASDSHYVSMGRWCTFIGVLISVGTAYWYSTRPASWTTCRLCSASFIAPLFGTVIWDAVEAGDESGGFWGLLAAQ